MKKNNKISIIVPVYNVPEKFLKKCIYSLINQTMNEIEILLIDDGTPNTSGKICDELAKIDNRIIVIHQQNKGLCGARNTGIKNATGEWIAFVDGDDWVEKDAYENLYNIGVNNNVDVVMFGYSKDYPSNTVVMYCNNYLEDNKIYSTKEDIEYIQKMILNYNANCAMVTTKLIKRELIEKYNIYYDEVLRQGAEGIEYNIRLFNYVKKAIFTDKYYYHYIYNDNSITTVHNEKNHIMVLECFKKIKTEVDLSDNEFAKWFYSRLKHVILTTAISGYFSPSNSEKYSIQKSKFKKYMSNELVVEALNNKNNVGIDNFRKLTLFFIKNNMFLIVKIISKIRNIQKSK